MTLATNLKSTALRLLSTYGRALTFTRVTEGSYNPVDSSTGNPTTTTFSGYGHLGNYKASEIDGDLIQQNDIKLTLYTASTRPLTGDTASADNVTYRVMDVTTINVQSTDVIYILQLRM